MRKRQPSVLLSLLREHKRNPSSTSLSTLMEGALPVDREPPPAADTAHDPEGPHKIDQAES